MIYINVLMKTNVRKRDLRIYVPMEDVSTGILDISVNVTLVLYPLRCSKIGFVIRYLTLLLISHWNKSFHDMISLIISNPQDQKACLDGRQGNCYTSLNPSNGRCRKKLPFKLSRIDCCCSSSRGRGSSRQKHYYRMLYQYLMSDIIYYENGSL